MIGKRQLYRRIAKETMANKICILENRTINSDNTLSSHSVNTDNTLTFHSVNSDNTLTSHSVNTDNTFTFHSVNSDNTFTSHSVYSDNYFLTSHSANSGNSLTSQSVNFDNYLEVDYNQNEGSEPSQALLDPKLFLSEWANHFKIPHLAINPLLKFLKGYFDNIPVDARTILKTPQGNKKLISQHLCKGEMIYFGLVNAFELYLSKTHDQQSKLELSFNIDGLPLFHSSHLQFWPILVSINNHKTPMVVSIYCGTSKPQPLEDYLSDFIQELKEVLLTGFQYKSVHYDVLIHSFICDAPAKSFLKCVKGHSGYSSCDKCTCYGSYINRRVVLNELDCPLRSDNAFCKQSDEDHHTGISPLSYLPIGMVTQFPFDYMHCVCLGVMKKLLMTWVKGSIKTVKLDANRIQLISDHLMALHLSVPKDFNRKPRGLNELDNWKATEFRTFLLYTGPLVLKDVLDKQVYEHFLYLHIGISILLSPSFVKQKTQYADKLLRNFVSVGMKDFLYGKEFAIYNVHSLIHLSKQAETYGVLDNISAFRFENFLGQLKTKIRSPNKPLQQVANRLSENKECRNILFSSCNKNEICLSSHNRGPLASQFCNTFCIQYEELLFRDSVISTKHFRDSCVVLNKGKIIIVKNIVSFQHSTYLIGNCFQKYRNYFTSPCESMDIGISITSALDNELTVYRMSSVIAKCVIFPTTKSEYLILPLLHSCW